MDIKVDDAMLERMIARVNMLSDDELIAKLDSFENSVGEELGMQTLFEWSISTASSESNLEKFDIVWEQSKNITCKAANDAIYKLAA